MFARYLLPTLLLGSLLGATAQDAPPANRFVTGQPDGAAGRTTRQAHFEIDEATRTLIVTTDPSTNAQIQEVLAALDKPVPQALIKVLFLEVTHNNDLDLGVEFSKAFPEGNGDSTVISSLFGVAGQTNGAVATILQNDLNVTLRAIAQVGTLNVLSRPSILARNNQEATITIGQEVPFIRNSRITDNGETINTVEYEDIGIILTVTPHIGANGLIELDVAPEISTITGDTVTISAGVEAPVFAKRSAETHVVVPSGKTVVIGGLMEDQETVSESKVPLLGDLPVVGNLFKRKVTSKSKTELLIFLTPTLVTSADRLVDLTTSEHQNTSLLHKETDPVLLERYLSVPNDGTVPATIVPAPGAPETAP